MRLTRSVTLAPPPFAAPRLGVDCAFEWAIWLMLLMMPMPVP